MEVSAKDNKAVMVYCYDCKKKKESSWLMLSMIHDEFEVLSGALNS